MNIFWKKIKKLNHWRNDNTRIVKNHIKLSYYGLKKNNHVKFLAENCSHIAILMHNKGIGDAIVLSGFIEKLKQNNKFVYIIAEKRLASLFENQLISNDGFIEFNPKDKSNKFKIMLNSFNFDLIIDFYDYDENVIPRARTISIYNKCPSIGFNQPKRTIFTESINYNKEKHISDRMLVMLDKLKITCNDFNYKINIPQRVSAKVDEFLQQNYSDKQIIIFNPFASCSRRTMSKDQINAVLKYLDSFDNYVTIVFDIAQKIELDKYNNVINNPFNSFDSACELVKKAHLVVTVDTSIVHVATAMNIKQIAIYNNRIISQKFQNNIIWAPNHPKAIQIYTNQHLDSFRGDFVRTLDINLVLNEIAKNV